jgi:hypothetical protein
MKKLLCLALLLTVSGCSGCTCSREVRIIHETPNPDDSMGIVVIPVPLPVPAPMPIPKMPPLGPKPKPLWRMWADFEDNQMRC